MRSEATILTASWHISYNKPILVASLLSFPPSPPQFGKPVSEGGGDSVRPIGNDGIEDVREERRVKRAVEKRKIEMDQLKKKFQGGEKDADWMPGREGMKDDDEPWFTG